MLQIRLNTEVELRPHVADSEYDDYRERIKHKLGTEGFELQGPQEVGGYSIDLFAFKHFAVQGANLSCWLVKSDKTDLQTVKTFSEAMFGLASRSLRGYVVALSVIASHDFDAESKEFVRGYKGFHWPRGMDHPVLAELSTRQIYHYDKKPAFVARIPFGLAIDNTKKFLSFE